ncbi:MAG: hypothetical protein JXR81_03520 [Candidatus Goldbacteria bacterium]|nr:hypothetical protein [Candidatus Goldiibacteriota bacterium]
MKIIRNKIKFVLLIMFVLFVSCVYANSYKYYTTAQYGKYSSIEGKYEVDKDNVMKVHGYEFIIDDTGRNKEITYFYDGKPAKDPFFNVCNIKFKYADNEEVRIYYDEKGQPTKDNSGSYDRHMLINGNEAVCYALNNSGDLVPFNGGSYKFWMKFEEGLVTEMKFMDKQDNFITDDYLEFKQKRYYDDEGRLKSLISFNDKSEKALNKFGYAEVKYEYEDEGTFESVGYFDQRGDPVEIKGGLNRKVKKMDSKGRVLMNARYNLKGELITHRSIKERDSYGSILKEYLMDCDGSIVSGEDGLGIIKREYDSQNRKVSEKYYDANENLMLLDLNGSAGFLYLYDETGKLARMVSLGIDGAPVYNNKLNFCIKEYSYFRSGDVSEIRFLGPDNEPLENPANANAVKIKYENIPEQGRRDAVFIARDGSEIKRSFYGNYFETQILITKEKK